MVLSSVAVSPTRSRSSVTVQARASRVRSDSRRSSSTDFCSEAAIEIVPASTPYKGRAYDLVPLLKLKDEDGAVNGAPPELRIAPGVVRHDQLENPHHPRN